MRKTSKVFLAMTLVISVMIPVNVHAEECKKFDLDTVFAWGYVKEFPTWTSPGKTRVIKWSALSTGESLNGKSIQSNFGSRINWLREAFDGWDQALDSIIFLEVAPNENPEIKIGYTNILELDYVSLFKVWPDTTNPANEGIRTRATIEFKYDASFLIPKQNFMQSAQFEIGRVLGLGYLKPQDSFVSVMEYPWQAPYEQLPLGEYDVALVRALYGESTCPSSFPSIFKAFASINSFSSELKSVNDQLMLTKIENTSYRERVLILETKVNELELLLKNSEFSKQEVVVRAELLDKEVRELKRQIADSNSKSTITCIKGKVKKKVSAVNPKCPKGFKKL